MNERAKHTEGPWSVWKVNDNEWCICGPEECGRHSHFASVRVGYMWHEEEQANAKLIAAAPDMLEALQALYEHCAMVHKEWGEGCNQKQADAAIVAGRAAIEKATGKA